MKLPRNLFGDFQTSVKAFVEQATKVLSGNVSFGSTTANTDPSRNMDCWINVGTAPVGPNTEFAVTHNLRRIPIGYIVIAKSIAGDFYTSTGGTAWTAATNAALGNIYLKCTVASVGFTIIVI